MSVIHAKKGDILYEVENPYSIREITFNPRIKHHMRMLGYGRLFRSVKDARKFINTLKEKLKHEESM